MYKHFSLFSICLLFCLLLSCSFTQNYFLDISISPADSGSVNRKSDFYPKGSITLIATPHTGYVFDSWNGDIQSPENPLTIILDDDLSISASFKYDLSALFTITSVTQPHYSSPNEWGPVEIYYTIANTGPNVIDYYEVYFDVTCGNNNTYSDWTYDFNVATGETYSTFTHVDVGNQQATFVKVSSYKLFHY